MTKLFAVRDVKADAFGAPMSAPTEGLAKRAFEAGCNNPKTEFYRYPEDFMLYEIGSYDPNSGELVALKPTPRLVCTAVAARQEAEAERLKREPVLPGVEVPDAR